jgi:hypothetical protein
VLSLNQLSSTARFVDQWTDATVDRLRLLPRAAGIAVLSLLAVACGHAPSARDVPPGASFAANILDDGTKLFTFSTHLPRPPMETARSLQAQERQVR